MKRLRVCKNSLCPIRYPHHHVQPDGGNPNWLPTIDDPAVSSPWPERLQWKRQDQQGYPFRVFKFGWFTSHSGFQLPFKIDIGWWSEEWLDIAKIIAGKFAFRSVYGIPRGGVKLAEALDPYCEPNYPALIVDDVLTTGRSMLEARSRLGLDDEPVIGVVVVARGPVPSWVWPILTVNDWAQSRATGLG